MSHINPDETLMLLIDHQSGLFQLVKDVPISDLRRQDAGDYLGICSGWSEWTIARIVQAGVIPIDTLAVLSELQVT